MAPGYVMPMSFSGAILSLLFVFGTCLVSACAPSGMVQGPEPSGRKLDLVGHEEATPSRPVLVGTVLAPPDLVSNSASGLISERAGALTGSQAIALEIPVPGARVLLVLASGEPVRGADGTVLETVTDVSGQYGLNGNLPPSTYFVTVTSRGLAGSLTGLALRDKVEQGIRQGSVDVSSSLLCSYIQKRLLNGVPGAQERLQRLDPPMVASAWEAMRDGLSRHSGIVQVSDADAAASTVDRIRQQFVPLEERIEALRTRLEAAD